MTLKLEIGTAITGPFRTFDDGQAAYTDEYLRIPELKGKEKIVDIQYEFNGVYEIQNLVRLDEQTQTIDLSDLRGKGTYDFIVLMDEGSTEFRLILKDGTRTYGFDKSKNKVEVCLKDEIGNCENLITSDKTNIVNAINEVFQSANDGKSKLADAIGNGATASMTFEQLANLLTTTKLRYKYEKKSTSSNSVKASVKRAFKNVIIVFVFAETYADYNLCGFYCPSINSFINFVSGYGVQPMGNASFIYSNSNQIYEAYINSGTDTHQGATYHFLQVGND